MILARGRAIPAGLALFSFVIALLQRPGDYSSDTKIDLHVNAAGFLGDVANMWADSGGLGQVQAGQYAGYLWPMGPFFALGDLVGVPEWLVHRLWLGALLALAAWGVVRLMDAVLSPERGAAHLIAGALFVLNPYVVILSNRTSVTLLGYAALPWLLLVVHRAARDPRSWRWPAAFALLVASSGGGVNAAVLAWVLTGPILLLAYEWRLGTVGGRAALRLAVRTAVLSFAASAWWIVPTAVHARFGINFLPFTESVGAIWSSTSLTESLRLMGYWISYLEVGFNGDPAPYFDDSAVLLFDRAVLLATLLVPALALLGFTRTHRWRYAPYFLGLGLIGLFVMMAGYPGGTPFRDHLSAAYDRLEPIQFLRTTHKAGPLLALAIACLAGAAAAWLWPRLRGRGLKLAGAVAAAALLALNAWPLVRGEAIDKQVTWDEIPQSWRSASNDLDRELPEGQRALILPGQLFGFYSWGATVDPILPALGERPISVRSITPYSDLHAAELLWTVDELISQQRLLPGQLAPLLDLLHAGAVVAGSDDDLRRSGAMHPADAVPLLEDLGGLGSASRSYGSNRPFEPLSPGPARSLPEVRRYDRSPPGGLVRIAPQGSETVIDGSAAGVVSAAGTGALAEGAPLRYAGDIEAAAIRAAAEVVITDSNRRSVYVSSTLNQSRGPVLAANADFPDEGPLLGPFPEERTDAQTVAVYEGARALRAPLVSVAVQYPEHRPFAAFDGDPRTSWLADRRLPDELHWIEIEFERSRDIDYLELLPARVASTRVTDVEVNGTPYRVGLSWTRLAVALEGVKKLRVQITAVGQTSELDPTPAIAEIRIPGLDVRESLRPPTIAESALSGSDAATTTGLSYVFTRMTGDRPFRRSATDGLPRTGEALRTDLDQAFLARPGDPELRIRRTIEPPAERDFELSGWGSVDPRLSDSEVDRLAGVGTGLRAHSSGRFEGVPGRRASAAFDGDPETAWVGDAGGPAWIEWEGQAPVGIHRLSLAPARGIALPRLVQVFVGRTSGGSLVVGRDGQVRLPTRLRGRKLRIEILEPRQGAVGIAEVRAPGVTRLERGTGQVNVPCGAVVVRVRAGAQARTLSAEVSRADFDGGAPLRLEPCGEPLRLGADPSTIEDAGGPLRAYALQLRSPGAEAAPEAVAGQVLDFGEADHGERDGVRVSVAEPSWLILGESYNEGWRAECGGVDLGKPEVLDGYANGWRVDSRCTDPRFTFAANRWAKLSYAISVLAALLLLVLFLKARSRPLDHRTESLAGFQATPLAPPRALLAGALAAPLLAYLFGAKGGLALVPMVVFVLWRGWHSSRLAGVAGLALAVVVPALYLLRGPDERGGWDKPDADALAAPHWVGVAAYVLLVLALGQTLRRPRYGERPWTAP